MSISPTVGSLAAQWRTRAAGLRRWAAAEGAACALECAADELDSALQAEGDRVLTLQEASQASGYSADHLGRLLRDGRIPNAGTRGRPRIQTRNLPQRARRTVATSVIGPYDPVADARTLRGRR